MTVGIAYTRIGAATLACTPPARTVLLFPHRDGADRFIASVVAVLSAHRPAVLVPDLFAGMPADLTPEERKRRVVDADAGARHAFVNHFLPDRFHAQATRRAMAAALGFLTDASLTTASGAEVRR